MSVKLNPGDLVLWVEDEPERSAALLVGEDGESLYFQFGRKPWHETTIKYETGDLGPGMTVADAEAAINLGVYPVAFPGRLYKSYDEATGRSFADPNLEL